MSSEKRSNHIAQDSPERLLLVDDTPTNLQVLYQTLNGRGYKLLIAKDGEQALTIARKVNPELILLDIMMPGIDGFQVCQKLKADPLTQHIAIVFLSALDDTNNKVKGLALGAVDYISKPFQADEVIARVETHLKIHRLEQSLFRRNKELEAANQRMREDLEAAANVQRSLLPVSLPIIKGWEFSWTYRPCDELGGDGLNIFQIDEDHVGMYILDVCGHGVPAALLAVTVMHRLSLVAERSTSLLVNPDESSTGYRIVSPAQVAKRLNAMYPMNSRARLYFTFLYGILDIRAKTFRFVSAGNPGPILVKAGQMAEIHDVPAVPIGLLEESEYEDTVLELNSGDRLYIHSDGLVEERNADGEEYGRQRLTQQVADQHQTMELSESMQFYITEAISWGGRGNLKDDASILGLQCG